MIFDLRSARLLFPLHDLCDLCVSKSGIGNTEHTEDTERESKRTVTHGKVVPTILSVRGWVFDPKVTRAKADLARRK